MRDCYKILGISKNASAVEIKRAYRKKVKLLHPDVSHSDSKAFRAVQQAYEVLSDVKSRKLFDESSLFKSSKPNTKYSWPPHRHDDIPEFDYRTWLLEQEDEESRAKLIFFDLIHNREDEAVAEFKQMNMNKVNFKLSYWFTKEDFMDYGFILAEELVIRKEYYDAVILLSQIVKMEQESCYFKFFFPEVQELARHILRNNIEGNINDELAIDAWERALDMNLGKKDDLYFLQKMADAYDRIGDHSTAKACREESFSFSSAL